MPTYIEKCCCKGRYPEGVMPRRHVSRPDLIARLLRDRHVARFIVAPTGFGKSCLAFEYADVVLSFQHVFWLDGRSPCFLRDLDADVILTSIRRVDLHAALVVCEDVPRLDDGRAQAFGHLIDDLLAAGVEVIVTCVPSADAFSACQHDRVLLEGADLLLSAEEAAAWPASGGEEVRGGDELAQRIACVRWGEAGVREMLLGLKREELPREMRLALLVFLVLGQGSVDDLKRFLRAEAADELAGILARSYALAGVDVRSATYNAACARMEDLAEAFSGCMDDLASVSAQGRRDALCDSLADLLVERGQVSRAAAFEASFAAKVTCAAWMARRGWTVLGRGQALCLFELYDSVYRAASGLREALSALLAWAALALGDVPAALSHARRVARASAASPAERLSALVLLVRCENPEARMKAVRMLTTLIAQAKGPEGDASRARAEGWDEEACGWLALARIALMVDHDAQRALVLWKRAREALPSCSSHPSCNFDSVLLLGAAWILDAFAFSADASAPPAGSGRPSPVPSVDWDDVCELMDFVGELLERQCARGAISWQACLASAASEHVADTFGQLASHLPSPAAASRVREVEVGLLDQAQRRRRLHADRQFERVEFAQTHPDAFRKQRDEPRGVLGPVRALAPTLRVDMFGGMKVSIGDEPVSLRLLSRQKTRTLLALLVLSRGRETSKDRLSSMLWPDSSIEAARRNFYSVWSQLRRALVVGQTCPYLVRNGSGYRLDARLATSDVYAFEGLNRALLFGTADAEGWEKLYARICDEYPDDLMPCERGCELIDSLRERYRMQLVDGLVAAAVRLGLQGEVRGSLWFAREALRRDKTREDAYVALMEAQIAADQRGAALETYFSCRRFLSDELGIDPSPRVVGLYRSIIEVEEAL